MFAKFIGNIGGHTSTTATIKPKRSSLSNLVSFGWLILTPTLVHTIFKYRIYFSSA